MAGKKPSRKKKGKDYRYDPTADDKADLPATTNPNKFSRNDPRWRPSHDPEPPGFGKDLQVVKGRGEVTFVDPGKGVRITYIGKGFIRNLKFKR